MKRIQVYFSSKKRTYPIFIGKGVFNRHSGDDPSADGEDSRISMSQRPCLSAGRDSGLARMTGLWSYSKIVVITDTNVKKLLKNILNHLPYNVYIIIIPAGERVKSIKYVSKIWEEMLRLGCDRKSLIVNFGGGAVLDVGGFAASTYMRGIDFLNIPTTLLAQVDASIGGKTGIDFAGIKNLIGTFNQPKAVIIDIQTLATLPKREFISGFAEIMKHGLSRDRKYFEKVTSKHPLEFSQDELIDIIQRSCEIKAEIVEADETENGLRKLLNFGHTIGHAIEALSLETNRPLLHGEAVGIGMLAEAKISRLLDMISASELEQIKQSLQNAGLPISFEHIQIDKVTEKMQSDKKNEKGKVNFTLLEGIGKAVYDQNVSKNVIIEAIKYIQNKIENI